MSCVCNKPWAAHDSLSTTAPERSVQLPAHVTLPPALTHFKARSWAIKHPDWSPVSVPASFILDWRCVLNHIFAVRAPPISIFGSQPATAREDGDDDQEMTTSQIVNHDRVRSYGRMNDQNEADVNVRHKRSKIGKKVVPPRSYPGFSQPAPSRSGSTTGKGKGKIAERAPDEAAKIAVLCLPRTVCHQSPFSS